MKILNELAESFQRNANPDSAAEMKRYMRNQFEFFGIQAPRRYEIFRDTLKSNPVSMAADLKSISKESMKMLERDFHHFAIYLWEKNPKLWEIGQLDFFGWLIDQKPWWDTADYLINKVIAPYAQKFESERKRINAEWNNSNSVWKIRASILYQLKYKEKTDEKVLKELIINQKDHPDFFVRKAIGWMLREYSKTHPTFVLDFVNGNDLSPLSKREALKWLVSKNRI